MTMITKLGAFTLAIGFLAPLTAAATSIDEVIAQMEAKGYTNITVEKSFLGRTEIEGRKNNAKREVVLNSSGNILRDEIEMEDDDDDNEKHHKDKYDSDDTNSND